LRRSLSSVVPPRAMFWIMCAACALVRPGAGRTAVSDEFRAAATNVAVKAVAERLGVDPATLTVTAWAQSTFVYLGQWALDFKITDEKGQPQSVAVTPDLRTADAGALATADREARKKKLGALDPALAERLDKGGAERLPVVVWVVDRSPRAATRPRSGDGALTPQQIDELYAATDKARAAVLAKVVGPVLARVRVYDAEAGADPLSPGIFASLAPEALRALAGDPEIDRIYLRQKAEQELGEAKSTVGIPLLNGAGLLGDGVKIALTEVEGRVESNSLLVRPVVQDTAGVCPDVSDHSTQVASVILERQLNWFGSAIGENGAAPNVQLRVGGSCASDSRELTAASSRAANWGARAINMSWGFDTGLAMRDNDRFYDDMTLNRWRTIVKSAGNRGCATPGDEFSGPGSGITTSPGLGFNVITVGGFDDKNTASWSDDSLYTCTSFANPMSTHADREKPELSAPAANLTLASAGQANLRTVSGTSGAAPMVTATVALMIQRNGMLAIWPEILRALLMATATHNIEGSTRLSDLDGAGGLVANAAADLVTDTRRWGGLRYTCDASTASPLTLATLSVGPNTRQRVVLSWDTDPSFNDWDVRPSADIDLRVIDTLGRVVASSASFDNASEIVDFTSLQADTFTVQAVKFRCDLPTWLGWAWQTLPSNIKSR
jgi:subtilisin family serine protease